jgi:hypothetical protein
MTFFFLLHRVPSIFLLVFCLPQAGTPQGVIEIHDTIGRAAWRIELSEPLTLRQNLGTEGIPPWASVARDSRGRVYLAPADEGGVISVYDNVGRRLEAFGRHGNGVGELSNVLHLEVSAGDTLRILDLGNRRLTTFSPELVWTGSMSLPSPEWVGWDFFMDSNNDLILHAFLSQKGRIGIPIHRINLRGEVLSSFGGPQKVFRVDRLPTSVRVIASAGSDQVWIAGTRRYEIELWDSGGRRGTRRVRDPAWFPSVDVGRDSVLTPGPRDGPTISALWQDPVGFLWVFSTLPAPAVMSPDTGRIMSSPPPPGVPNATVIEVIDPNKSVLLASRRFPGRVVHIQESPFVFSRIDDHAITLWRLQLTPYGNHGKDGQPDDSPTAEQLCVDTSALASLRNSAHCPGLRGVCQRVHPL